MNDKIKRLAKNITELLINTSTPQDTYFSLVQLMMKQKDYFQHMLPENIVKLVFYCYSLGKTNSYTLGDKMLNKITFAVVIRNTGDIHQEDCDNCSGNGELSCEECDGDGKIDCGECDGDGKIDCPQCNGTGEIEDGEDMIECDECNGGGNVTCGECGGDGRLNCGNCSYGQETCDQCDGNGQIDTDSFDYERYFIVTWDQPIKERCELTEGQTEITMSEYDFDRLRDDFIKLKIDEKWDELSEWVKSNEIYCTYYNDNPKMYLTTGMYLDTSEDNIDAYT